LKPEERIILRFHNGLKHNDSNIKTLSGLACLFLLAWLLLFLYSCAGISSESERRGNFYINLNEYPLYTRNGFDPSAVSDVPDISGGSWGVKLPGGRKGILSVEALGLPDIPRRFFLSPFKEADREYTMKIPFSVSPEEFEKISGKEPFQPGIFLAALGNNWEIFFNGRPVKSEMHLDGNGRIKSGRAWRYVSFPLDRSMFVPGTNILTFRIAGSPHFDATGLWYENPYYIGDYEDISRTHDESLVVALCAVYFFVALYHFLLFMSRRKDRYNLYYCFFSIFLGIYFFTRSNTIYRLIPNSDITFRLEYASLYMMTPMISSFLEHFNFEKTKIINRVYTGLCLFLALSQGIFPNTFGDDLLYIWWAVALTELGYVLGYDILYVFCRDVHARWRAAKRASPLRTFWDSLTGTPLGNIIIGAVVLALTAIIDIINSIYLRYGVVNFSRFGIFIFTIATTVILARRFGSLFRRLDEMNTLLEISNRTLEATVRERTRELERQTEVAQAASRAKSDFLARMSHEIRTPLNAVLGLSEVELQKDLPKETRGNLDKVYHSGAQLLEIVNDILDISKIESGNFEIVPGEYELSGVINDAIQINVVRIGLKQLAFKLELDETIPLKLYGDGLRVKQILNNLLSNAFKYTEEGEVRLSVSWERRGDDALLTFAVKDTGLGIKKENIEKLFSDYIQFDAAANRRIEGTGLGLSITRGLAEKMGGSIDVESEYGKGSVFLVTLPQRILDNKPIGRELAEDLRNFRFIEDRNRSRGNTLIRSHMPYGKVLVVDDLQTNLDVMTGLLMPYGLRVDTVLSGQEAVERIRAEKDRYDLVFMDHMMPEMDGAAAVRIIRNEIGSPYARQVAIVALTANAVVGNREMFLNSGFTDFISKPIDIYQLDMVLNSRIRDRQDNAVLKDAENRDRGRPETDGGFNRARVDPEGEWLLKRSLGGIDFAAALTLYGGSGTAYIPILKSFITHTPLLLEKMDTHLEMSPADYAIEVHGLKGTCNAVGAVETGALARELERASKEGNVDLVRGKHGTLRKQALELTERLKALLDEWDAGRTAEGEQRAGPERALLARLSSSAAEFNANAVEEILGELERYHYREGQEFVEWLREQAENFDYHAMHKRLEEFLGTP
jgi:signal transduction histidine kinase/DNA-binding response OmpR family regulator/HPt (histidine-containing phosphotransfer) domain-containing protein